MTHKVLKSMISVLTLLRLALVSQQCTVCCYSELGWTLSIGAFTTTFHMASVRDHDHPLLHPLHSFPHPQNPPPSKTNQLNKPTQTAEWFLFGLLKAQTLGDCSFAEYCVSGSAEERERNQTWKCCARTRMLLRSAQKGTWRLKRVQFAAVWSLWVFFPKKAGLHALVTAVSLPDPSTSP